MPEGLDELLLGGFLARKRIEMVKCVTVDLDVPASSHIVLEGYVNPGERRREGLRRSHGAVILSGRLSGLSSHLHHATQAPDVSDHPSSACRRWRTTISASRASGFSCR